MGQEISSARFKHHDFHRFERLIEHEASVLHDWFEHRTFSERRSIAGLELEAWLVADDGSPVPLNAELLQLVDSPEVVPELSKFNIEFNATPQPLSGIGITRLESELTETWGNCDRLAGQLGASVVAIGTLPTIADEHLSLTNMSESPRYRALNEQVLRLRQGRPIRMRIEGRERLETEHRDVMLEAGATSFQLHLQVPQDEAVRFYNASLILSAPLAAISANSPWLFGRVLWEETRIPLFEQAVDVGGGTYSRVTFGSGYAGRSLEEFFLENRTQYPVLLPLTMDDPSEHLAHLRLHNGTIWRWTRPLIGFDEDGRPHLRIEQRIMAAGPSLVDMAANMAFFYGLIEALATNPVPPETQLPFALARDNFYAAAQGGLASQIVWLDGRTIPVRDLILRQLLPLARCGLQRLHADPGESERLLGIIEARTEAGRNGAVWQREFIEQHGRDLPQLTRVYRDRQRAGHPVHSWEV
ncbi:MAG: glutamate-cysteine ligase family protein [Planctomycetales bacterium]